MKKISAIKVLLIALILMLPVVSNAIAQEEAAKPETAMAEAAADSSAVMTINRFVTCQSIENREPAGETTTFTAGTETAYAFLEARSISADLEVNVVWIYDGNEGGKGAAVNQTGKPLADSLQQATGRSPRCVAGSGSGCPECRSGLTGFHRGIVVG